MRMLQNNVLPQQPSPQQGGLLSGLFQLAAAFVPELQPVATGLNAVKGLANGDPSQAVSAIQGAIGDNQKPQEPKKEEQQKPQATSPQTPAKTEAPQAPAVAPQTPQQQAPQTPQQGAAQAPAGPQPQQQLTPQQQQALQSLPPEVFAFVRENPLLGPALTNFWQIAQNYTPAPPQMPQQIPTQQAPMGLS